MNSVDPDQTPRFAALELGLYCLLNYALFLKGTKHEWVECTVFIPNTVRFH